MYKVVIPDPPSKDMSLFEQTFSDIEVKIVIPLRGDCWVEQAEDADGLIVNLVQVDSKIISRLKKCRIIARLGTGTDNVDIKEARRSNIDVCNVTKYCSEEVSEHVMALILSLNRFIVAADRDIQSKNWGQMNYRPIRNLSGKILGLIGYGKLAQAVAQKGKALGMKIIAYDPYVKVDHFNITTLTDLDQVLSQSDILSLHVPLTEETRHLIDERSLKKIKSEAFIINAARGGLIDESALAAAIDRGEIAGAGIDVFDQEPLEDQSPLRGRKNVVLTPHIAFYSEQSLRSLQLQAADMVARVLRGETPINVVNR